MNSKGWSEVQTKLRHVSVDITSHIERLIASGELAPGEKLPPERELAEKLGTSRSSVREAMYELTLKGLVERKPGRGTTVVGVHSNTLQLLGAMNNSQRAILEVVDLRDVFEPLVAARAAERATPASLRQLKAILDRTQDSLTPASSVSLDEEFHLGIARATQNSLLVTLANITSEWLREARYKSHATKAGRRASLQGHQKIYDAIQRRDGVAATAAMAAHLADVAGLISEEEGDGMR